jgi:ComF family protein
MFSQLIALLFPSLCVGCNQTLVGGEFQLCTVCIQNLPETHFHTNNENDLEKTFWGRIPIEHAFAFLMFKKMGVVQHILHELKYNNNPDLGVMLGNMYGEKLKQAGLSFDGIIAVPLHPKKQKLRGYNQSDCFAVGLSEALNSKHLNNVLVRNTHTETQTKKSRFARWQNVGEVFQVNQPELIQNKKILLVDDVITTGATIEACSLPLLDHTPHLSIGSIACVVHQ